MDDNTFISSFLRCLGGVHFCAGARFPSSATNTSLPLSDSPMRCRCYNSRRRIDDNGAFRIRVVTILTLLA